MNYQEVLGQVAALIVAISILPYLYSIVMGKTVPNMVTWLVWSAIGFAFLYSYKDAGATHSLPMAFIGFINPLLVLILSLKYGEKVWTLLDKLCLVGAFVSITICILGSATTALVSALIADTLGCVPTIKKVWHKPKSEAALPWVMFVIASIMNIFAVESLTFEQLSYPVYMLCGSFTITFLIVKSRKKV